jgi:hypothetical protein
MNEYEALVQWHGQGKTKVLKRQACSSATLTTTNPTGNGMGLKPGVREGINVYPSLFKTA